MATNVHSREKKMRQEIKNLQIVIEESKVKEEVSRITESEFFQSLAERAKKMRADNEQRKMASDSDSA